MSYLVVTSRCPVSHDKMRGKEVTKENVGGVATALKKVMQKEGGVWICWGDGKIDDEYQVEDLGKYKIVRVILTQHEKRGFYDDYSNGTLWPLFHYFRDRIKITQNGFKHYKHANEKFKEKILENLDENMKVWIHDYQLTLLPGMLREAGMNNFMLFTWHIPWVAPEFFSILPNNRYILKSMLESDMITFHTELYTRNFRNSCELILKNGYDLQNKLFSYSLGIDNVYYNKKHTKHLPMSLLKDKKMIFSIDRLDYTKGLSNRVMAIENLIRRHPEYTGKFVYVMAVTPSRTSVSEYSAMKKDLEMTIGRVNGEYGTIDWVPIIYMFRKISDKTLVSYYKTASIALITPLIDGLNLVSKEFVAATNSGVLIISEFAGASYDLTDAIRVNPNNLDEMADKIVYALNMDEKEVLDRLTKLKENVSSKNLEWWVRKITGTAERKMARRKEHVKTRTDIPGISHTEAEKP